MKSFVSAHEHEAADAEEDAVDSIEKSFHLGRVI